MCLAYPQVDRPFGDSRPYGSNSCDIFASCGQKSHARLGFSRGVVQPEQSKSVIRRNAMKFDIAIVGAGPVGLSFARSLALSGLRIALIEQQPETTIADPPFDGREIALTHRSADIMRHLGMWNRIPEAEISPLRDAQVFNGSSTYAMRVDHTLSDKDQLGYLVPNHLIRRAAYETILGQNDLTLLTNMRVSSIHTNNSYAELNLADGQQLHARLVVAADTRFSETRRAMGIPSDMYDFGKTMLVCRMDHTVPHEHVAWEWFDYGQTKALLPLNGLRSSVVLTLPQHEMQSVLDLPESAFNRDIERRFQYRLGRMSLISPRCSYPLVGVYPKRFVAHRFALIGDAAVGMHPVTAHGFNFGLRSQQVLAREILAAHESGRDIAEPALLARYERNHRLATRPLYLATQVIARIYTDDTMPARMLRNVALRLAQNTRPFKQALAATLTGEPEKSWIGGLLGVR